MNLLTQPFEEIAEYSENPEALKELLKDVEVYLSEPELKLYFPEDKEQRNVYTVTVRRAGREIQFTYGDSTHNTEKGLQPTLYDILCCLGNDLYLPESFEDFCSEYGYDEDSRKAEHTYKLCQEQNKKLLQLFKEEDGEVFPR